MKNLIGTKRFTLISLVVAGLLSSCTTSMLNSRQSLQQAGMLSTVEIAAQYHVDSNWWEIYQDPKLNQLVEMALTNNINLRQAALNVEKARYSAKLTEVQLFPTASGSLGASSSKDLKHGGASSRSFNGQIGLSYEVDLWQKLRASTDVAIWKYHASEQDLYTSRLSLINSVIDGYFHLAYIDEAIGLTQNSINQYRKIARIAQAQYQSGKVSSINAINAKQSLLNAQNILTSLQKNRTEVMQMLHDLLNQRPGDVTDIRPTALGQIHLNTVNLNVPLSVLANRPDLRAAEFRLQAAYAAQQAARRSWYPSISLNTVVNSRASDSSSALRFPVGVASVNVNLPFLDWQALHWQNRQAEAEFVSAKLSFEQSLTTALNEVARYYRLYTLSQATLENTQKKYQYDQKNSRYYHARYQYGANPLSDWLDALNKEYSSAQNVLNDRYAVLQYENLIYQAMAGRYQAR
ncbi:MAG: TolC family protein [Snodgrassella sp.]|nr:TolC family protein [Snodgrassella sp.]